MSKKDKNQDTSILPKVIAHAKEYGFVFPSSEIYDGLQAVYDYGSNGVELKNNLKEYWWKAMTQLHSNIVGIDVFARFTSFPPYWHMPTLIVLFDLKAAFPVFPINGCFLF